MSKLDNLWRIGNHQLDFHKKLDDSKENHNNGDGLMKAMEGSYGELSDNSNFYLNKVNTEELRKKISIVE